MTTAMTARTATRAGSARRRMRVAAAAAGLAAALVLTGCSSDDGDAGAEESSAAPTATDTADSGGSGGSGGSSAADSKLQGNWLATTGGKAVALFVNGDEVAVFVNTSVCSGKISDAANMQMISLKCSDGNADRTEGMIDSVSSKSLTITWEGGVGEETYRKAEGSMPSGLPTDLPTADLGS